MLPVYSATLWISLTKDTSVWMVLNTLPVMMLHLILLINGESFASVTMLQSLIWFRIVARRGHILIKTSNRCGAMITIKLTSVPWMLLESAGRGWFRSRSHTSDILLLMLLQLLGYQSLLRVICRSILLCLSSTTASLEIDWRVSRCVRHCRWRSCSLSVRLFSWAW